MPDTTSFQHVPSDGFSSLQLDAVSRYIEGGGSLALQLDAVSRYTDGGGSLALQLDAVSRYIEGGGSLTASGRHGNTWLHAAAAAGNLELLLYLVEKGMCLYCILLQYQLFFF